MPARFRGERLGNAIAEIGARGVTLPGHLHRALHLHSFQRVRRTRRASSQVLPQGAGFRGIEFPVDIGIELAAPLLTSHLGLPRPSSATSRAGPSVRETSATLPCPSE